MSKKDFLILCLFLALLLCVFTLHIQYKRNEKLVNEKLTERITSAKSVSRFGNDNHINNSYLCAGIENFDCLIGEAAKAIENNPNDPLGYNNRAYGYLRLNKLELAEKDIEKALQLDSNHTLALNNRGLLRIKQGKFDLALKDIEKAAQNDSTIPEIYLNKGLICAGKKQYRMAVEEFSKAIRMNHALAIAYEERGNVYKLLNKTDKAEADRLEAEKIRENR